jgi:AbrB family looped-hinge helix DNA binding protein
MESAVTTKGQTTIPKEIRERWGLRPGDKVRFFYDPSGRVSILPVRPVSDLRGIAKGRRPALTVEEMDEAIAEAVVERDRRSRR